MLSKNKIKQLQALKTKKGRQEQGLFIAEGIKIVEELIKSDMRVREVFTLSATAQGLIPGSKSRLPDLIEITEAELKKISSLHSPNSILAIAEISQRNLDLADLKDKLTLVLEDIQDPGNMGTIIRIADWFGIENIICSMNTVDCYNSKVVQASMGSIARVKIHSVDLMEFLTSCKNLAFKIYGALLEGETVYTQKLSNHGLIVIGNESKGISGALQTLLTNKINIPHFSHIRKGRGEVESLNAAVAAGIICSEFRRSSHRPAVQK